ncbi:VOC family protein [Paenibacillus filicis]|uniref:VOC family protein n=1 Tax=Paenibacillus gyeongsangnamensis TaxID=3388067 RepID=A0ABT4QIH0_9BACL|nr:VOC family protein [Paenibacillus filicis]MCZ8516683.1 VOC family protein [Paenibacillus filicis]
MNFHRNPNTYVGQLNLKVQNLQRALQFYQEVIGFKVLDQTEKTANLTADGKTVLLSIEQPDNVVPMQERTTGLYHFALLLPTRTDLAQIVQHFAKIGLQFGSSDHLVSESLYLSDPDGNGIEVFRDRDPSEWVWNNGEVEVSVDPLNFRDLLSCVNQKTWRGLPAGTVMGHIHLHVSELRMTEEFYVKGLGFEVVIRYGTQALFISTGKYHHHIGLNTWNGLGAPRPSENSVGLKSFTLIYPNITARDHVVAHLENIGAPITEENSTFATTDPSGNRILLLV